MLEDFLTCIFHFRKSGTSYIFKLHKLLKNLRTPLILVLVTRKIRIQVLFPWVNKIIKIHI